jgi:hypothetical protein
VSKKEDKEPEDSEAYQKALTAGAPDIAHPDDDEKWELQKAFFTAFLFEMWERVEARNKKASREARAELQTFLLNSLGQSLRLALDDKDSIASKWACELLADIFVSIGKHTGKVRIKKPYGKLMDIKAFKDEKSRIGKVKTSVLFPGLVRAIVQRELKTAMDFRKRLILLSASSNWRETAKKQKIPEAYWSTVELLEFSMKSEPDWWKFLWSLIQKKIDLSKLPPLAQRDLDSPGGIKARKRYLSDCEKAARDHLKVLGKLRDKGAFF